MGGRMMTRTKITLDEKQRRMRERNGKLPKIGRPTIEEARKQAWDDDEDIAIQFARVRFLMYSLHREGYSDQTIATVIKRIYGLDGMSAARVRRWLDDGAKLHTTEI